MRCRVCFVIGARGAPSRHSNEALSTRIAKHYTVPSNISKLSEIVTRNFVASASLLCVLERCDGLGTTKTTIRMSGRDRNT